jgi:uncharacterized membrane protein YvlD (DUF360 family)
MPKFLLSWLLGLGANAVALLLCGILFKGFHLSFPLGFIWAVVIFAVLSLLFTWISLKFLLRHAGSLIALSGLMATFLALFTTAVLTDGLSIDGLSTWLLSTLLIWLVSMFIWVIPGPWRTFRKADPARR